MPGKKRTFPTSPFPTQQHYQQPELLEPPASKRRRISQRLLQRHAQKQLANLLPQTQKRDDSVIEGVTAGDDSSDNGGTIDTPAPIVTAPIEQVKPTAMTSNSEPRISTAIVTTITTTGSTAGNVNTSNAKKPSRNAKDNAKSSATTITTSDTAYDNNNDYHRADSNDPKVVFSPRDVDSPQQSTPRHYWLMKAEPNSRIEKGKDMKFSIDDLIALNATGRPAEWDGVRNYVARNHMRAMRKGDLAFFYHSNCKEPGIVGIIEIVEEATPDETAFDPKEPYYDPKSSRNSPKWVIVKVEFQRKLSHFIGLAELKSHVGGKLKNLALLKQSRLSISPVSQEEWEFILSLEEKEKEME